MSLRHWVAAPLAAGMLIAPWAASAQSFLDKLREGARLATEQTQKLQQAAVEFSDAQEREMGRQWAGVLLGAAPLVEDAELQRYVNLLGRWIALHSERPALPWTFGVLDTGALNAFATPGGYVFITKGLLLRTRDEAELAGVLAHEIVHVTRRHHLNAMKKSAGMAYGADVLAQLMQRNDTRNADVVRKAVSGAKELLSRGLDKSDEHEADRLGVALAARAGFDPWGLPAVLQTLNAVNATDGDVALLFATHPNPAARLDAVASALTPELERLQPRLTPSEGYRTRVEPLRAASAASP